MSELRFQKCARESTIDVMAAQVNGCKSSEKNLNKSNEYIKSKSDVVTPKNGK
jgi:hypothetical protein